MKKRESLWNYLKYLFNRRLKSTFVWGTESRIRFFDQNQIIIPAYWTTPLHLKIVKRGHRNGKYSKALIRAPGLGSVPWTLITVGKQTLERCGSSSLSIYQYIWMPAVVLPLIPPSLRPYSPCPATSTDRSLLPLSLLWVAFSEIGWGSKPIWL